MQDENEQQEQRQQLQQQQQQQQQQQLLQQQQVQQQQQCENEESEIEVFYVPKNAVCGPLRSTEEIERNRLAAIARRQL